MNKNDRDHYIDNTRIFLQKNFEKGYDYIYSELLEIIKKYNLIISPNRPFMKKDLEVSHLTLSASAKSEEEIEIYNSHDAYFIKYIISWAADCLLGAEKYQEYLKLTEPEDLFFFSYNNKNLTRCNVFYHINQPVNIIDVLKLNYSDMTKNLNKYTLENKTEFQKNLIEIFSKDIEENGPLLNRMLGMPSKNKTTRYNLFSGVVINGGWDPYSNPKPNFSYYKFDKSRYFINKIPELIRQAENLLRDKNNLPKIGEGWISETELYYAIKNAFLQTKVIQHGKPIWLGNQHLDIWFPDWKIAVEYHGKQHFEPVEFFGGIQGYEATKERDARKKALCQNNNVELIVVTENINHEQVINLIKNIKGF